jgi:hypothetical protein
LAAKLQAYVFRNSYAISIGVEEAAFNRLVVGQELSFCEDW